MRRIQTMVRLTEAQRDALDAIAIEIEHADRKRFAEPPLRLNSDLEPTVDEQGEPNKSATIRRILAEYDERLR